MHAESQYKYENENESQNMNMQAFPNPSGSEESKQESGGNVLSQFVTQVAQSDLPQ